MGAGALPSFPRQALLSEASASPVAGRPLIPLPSPALLLSPPPLILLSFEAGIWEQCLPCSLPPGWSRRQTIGVACCQGPGRGGSARQHLPQAGGGNRAGCGLGKEGPGVVADVCVHPVSFLGIGGLVSIPSGSGRPGKLCANVSEDAHGNSNNLTSTLLFAGGRCNADV